MGLKRDLSGNGPTENVHGKVAKTGTWAYQAAGEYMVRRMATTINGSADDVLQSGGSNHPRRSIHVRSDQIGAKLGTAHRAGYWRPTGISGQRNNWSSSLSSANANYAANTGSLSATSDDAARVTPWNSSGIPAELVYLETGKVSTANMKDYPYKSAVG